MANLRSVTRLCSRIQSLSGLKINPKSFLSDSSPFIKSTPKISYKSHRISRLPVELSALITMMPLHSAIASSCLKSGLLLDSQSWGLVPQGVGIDFGGDYLIIAFVESLDASIRKLELGKPYDKSDLRLLYRLNEIFKEHVETCFFNTLFLQTQSLIHLLKPYQELVFQCLYDVLVSYTKQRSA